MRKALLIFLLLIFSTFRAAGPEFSARNRIKVGVFYYPWYAEGYGNGHWSGDATDHNLPGTWWTVVDRPALDWYASNDAKVIRRHLDWFAYAHIDFGIISWWGPIHDEPAYDDDWAKALFNETRDYAPWFRWVISIEPCYNVTEQGLGYLATLRNYVYDNYVVGYHAIWLNETDNGQPFLFWMNGDDLVNATVRTEAKNDTRFVTRILGQSGYVDWKTWTPYRGCNITTPFPPSADGFMCVMPRYDETRLDPEGKTPGGPRTIVVDRDLDGSGMENGEPLYDKQWKEVLSNASAVKFVAIATWNDFTERTQIEPCYDLTSAHIGNTTYLLDRTKYWIKQLNDAVPNEVLNITDVEWQPNASVTPSQEVEVNATVTNSFHSIENVWLRYTTNATTDWNCTTMNLSSSNVYNGTIPPQRPNTLVNFTIIACDNASNYLIDDNNGRYYTYSVIPEFSSFLIMAPIMMVAPVAVVAYGRKHHFSGR